MDKKNAVEEMIGTKILEIKRSRVPYTKRNKEYYYYEVSGGNPTLKIEKKSIFHFNSVLITEGPIKDLEEGNKKYIDVPLNYLDVFYKKRKCM